MTTGRGRERIAGRKAPLEVACVVGTRPEFVQVAPVLHELGQRNRPILVHTGQHYNVEMSSSFFDELMLPEPDYNLEVGSGSHAAQTAEIMLRLEPLLEQMRPDAMLVFGDTNSTLAGGLTAAKLRIPVGHVEAGMRSYNRSMPEEINRVIVDHLSDYWFCPTQTAVANLRREGVRHNVHLTGDVMLDSIIRWRPKIVRRSMAQELGLKPNAFRVLTLHRAGNVDDPSKLRVILNALTDGDLPIVFPVHPRTRKRLKGFGKVGGPTSKLMPMSPLGYFEFLSLLMDAKQVCTDSGGVQKQAYILGVPCITLREETEWVETVRAGWNVLAGADPKRIHSAMTRLPPKRPKPGLFGDGHASQRIVRILEEATCSRKGADRFE